MKRVFLGLMIALLIFVLTANVVYAASPDKIDAYVEPMVGGQAGEHGKSGNFQLIDGRYFNVSPSDHSVMVPVHATNLDGEGRPEGPRAEQGEPDYSPIWAEGSGPGG
jgi:hypothetical protein